ncbi:MAG: tRNA hydroxylase [Planctomycetaceae bacterium TMED10]|nr:MAG: tRNA hydroxylase [Planctomycetaceae bacterium TMED10]|tara:strand:- start:1 stop:576 length:576 start_codon:yes stop_codon:yes gene_type:complete
MLGLKSATTTQWVQQVRGNLEEVLIDHAHCEKKAARTAMNLLCAYDTHVELCREMTLIIAEELEHFEQVCALLNRRSITFRRQQPADYGKELNKLVRSDEPERAVDRLLVAGLIEARSCERFAVLRDHLEDQELSAFYGSLFESEARHHTTYLKLARGFASPESVAQRLDELASDEQSILSRASRLPRMHS